ncbi:MAG TPA: heparan-alpha-glucosaminide N-acetyltransferase domain-containing protein [Planctomycetaceae bacterium]|nr:heparan-alpha-glucosaminide N-acetyltransferase domain-containing protein [Planctomycetaceae bacterium]
MSIKPAVLPDHEASPMAPARSLSPPARRVDAVDVLRGAVMVLMVLDHTRDYFGDASIDPTDLSRVSAALFLTRWVTHFCAPVFAFLAGTGAYLAGSRGRSRRDLAAFLASRGIWLIFLELTIVRLGLFFDPVSAPVILTVLWSIGASFVVLAGLIFLPSRVVGALGMLLIATHGLASGLLPSEGASVLQADATLLLRPGLLPLPGGINVLVGYPLLPWLGVVAAGYGFGEVIRLEPGLRRRVMWVTGVAMIAAFVILRAWGVSVDPRPWTTQATPLLTGLSFINCTKQPPSLLFVLMTLGPAIAALAVLDRVVIRGPLGRAVVTFGRVPLFYYLLQWYVIHGLAVLAGLMRGLPVAWMFSAAALGPAPEGWSLSLPGIYVAWVVVLAVLYLPCRWFAGVKARHPGGWLSYL